MTARTKLAKEIAAEFLEAFRAVTKRHPELDSMPEGGAIVTAGLSILLSLQCVEQGYTDEVALKAFAGNLKLARKT